MTLRSFPVVVLGGSGYVAGELLRLLAGHPAFHVAAVLSESRRGAEIAELFPHLRGTAIGATALGSLAELEAVVAEHRDLGLLVALPHGAAAAQIDRALTAAERSGTDLRVVDLGSDFRHRDAATWESLYGQPHGAPHRLGQFHCVLPDLARTSDAGWQALRCVAHPGCFTTAATLALAPLHALGWIDPAHPVHVVAVTGSTGSGRTPSATTHHPERRSDLFAYAPLAHRHESEMQSLIAAAAPAAEVPALLFVPHSGPFARGIHATITARLARPADPGSLRDSVTDYLRTLSNAPAMSSPPALETHPSPGAFVRILSGPPRLQAVVGTNRCDVAFAVRGEQLVVFSAIDNLVKGAAGGGIQWMNRLFGLPPTTGLVLPGLGWL